MDLLKDDIRKVFIHYLVPSIGSATVMSIYYLVDFIVVGRGVGADGLAAFSILTPMLALIYFVGQLFGIGGSVMYSTRKGAGKESVGHQYFTLSLVAVLICAGIFWIVYALFHNQILTFLGASDTTLPYAWEYMRWYTIFLPVAMTSNFWIAFVRNDNDPVRAMAGTLLGGCVNIVLDIVFVFPCGMGMSGAALASVLGATLNVFIVTSHFWTKRNTLRLARPQMTAKQLPHIVGSGLSSAMVELSNVITIFFFNTQLLAYSGELAVSIYGIICNWGILFLSLFNGVGMATQPVISVNYGAGQKQRIAKTRNFALLCVAVMGVIFFLAGQLLTRPLITLFMEGMPEIFAISDSAVRIYFVAFLFMGFTLVLTYYFQSILWMKRAFACAVCRSIVFVGVFIFILPAIFDLNGVWAAFPAGEAAALALSVLILVISRKGKKDKTVSNR